MARHLRIAVALFAIALAAAPAVVDSDASVADIRVLDALIPMPDGVELSAKVFLPPGDGPFPATLLVTPYGTEQEERGDLRLAAEGYAVVTQNARGQGGAAGEPSPFLDELPDLEASLEWLVAQPWSDGRVGFVVGSSASYSAQLLASTGHPAIRALVNVSGLTDPQEVFFPGGAFRLNTLYPWLQFFYLHQPIRDGDEWDQRFTALPVAAGFGWEQGLLRRMAAARVDTSGIRAPTLHLTGWNDVVYRQTLLLHRELAARGVTQRLIVGPWMHNHIGSGRTEFGDVDYGPGAAMDRDRLHELTIAWLDRFLRGEAEGAEGPGAEVFIMGANEWRDFESWPPSAARELTLHLSAGRSRKMDAGSLDQAPPDPAVLAYSYDPTDPVPTFGGVNSHLFPDEAGPRDQAELGRRDDVLVFTTAPLEDPLTLAGPQRALIRFAADAPDADVAVKLVVVRPDGYELILEDGIQRARHRHSFPDPTWLEPNHPTEIEVDLGSTAYEIPTGHRLGIHVAASNFPKYDRNPSTREDPLQATELHPATHTIHLGGEEGSRVVLTVLD